MCILYKYHHHHIIIVIVIIITTTIIIATTIITTTIIILVIVIIIIIIVVVVVVVTPALSFSVFLFTKESYSNILLARSSTVDKGGLVLMYGWGLLKTFSIDCLRVSVLHFLLKLAFPLINKPCDTSTTNQRPRLLHLNIVKLIYSNYDKTCFFLDDYITTLKRSSVTLNQIIHNTVTRESYNR